jgi:hypothetical protein
LTNNRKQQKTPENNAALQKTRKNKKKHEKTTKLTNQTRHEIMAGLNQFPTTPATKPKLFT